MIVALLHGNFTPASCNAKISGIGQHIERMPPMPSKPRRRSVFDLPSFRLGIAKNINAIATAHIGPLCCMSANNKMVCVVHTYFMKKIQRHVDRSAMIPPSSGPNRLDIVKTELIRPE